MKKGAITLVFTLFFLFHGFSQDKAYWTSGTEMIFSFATIDDNGSDDGSIMRWAPVFNIQGMINKDFGENFGVFTGIGVRNVGYIYNNYTFMENENQVTVKKKFRTYNLAVPIGLKIGNMKGMFLYAGYEFELPFAYKEKTFRDEKKEKFTAWFSNRVEQFQHGFLVGFQFPYGTSIKFKYYISGFHNTDYTESTGNQPYKGLNSNIFYVSLNFGLFKNSKFYYSEDTSKEYF